MGVWLKAGGLAVAGLAALAFGALARAQAPDEAPPPGKAVYETYCAACHQAPEEGSRAAPVASLRKMSAPTIMSALTTGVMKPMGDQLDRRQLRDLVTYLAAPEGPVGTGWIDDHRCAADKASVDLKGRPAQVGFGVDTDSSRRMSTAQAGLSTKDLGRLEVAWTFALPRTTGLRGQGVVVGQTLFYPAGQANTVLALDTRTGCVKWASPLQGGGRSSLAYGRLGANGPWALVTPDGSGKLVALDAKTGKVIWRVDPRHDQDSPLSGSPLFAGDKILAPISASDVGAAMRPAHQCCKTHGALAAIDAATGKVLWTWHTMEPATPLAF